MDKMKMELVWHNCKTNKPDEKQYNYLILWNGECVINAEYDQGKWFDDGHTIFMLDEEDRYWWADLYQTTEDFFYGVRRGV